MVISRRVSQNPLNPAALVSSAVSITHARSSSRRFLSYSKGACDRARRHQPSAGSKNLSVFKSSILPHHTKSHNRSREAYGVGRWVKDDGEDETERRDKPSYLIRSQPRLLLSRFHHSSIRDRLHLIALLGRYRHLTSVQVLPAVTNDFLFQMANRW